MPTKRAAFLCAVTLLCLLSCNSKKEVEQDDEEEVPLLSNKMPNPFEESFSILDFHNGFNQLATQRFSIPANRVSMVTAAKGLKVAVDPSALEREDGASINAAIQVRIIELTNSNELFKSNAATLSNGKLLVSGGSYCIEMESGGYRLRIKKNRSLTVEFPRLKKGEMELFYGERNALEDMNWKRAGNYLREPKETISFNDDNSQSTVAAPVNRYSALTGHVFKSMESTVYLYDKKITIAALLDTVNKNSKRLCIDSISFWPPGLPANRVLDTAFLVRTYGPRFQYVIKTCQAQKVEQEEIARRKQAYLNKLYSDSIDKINNPSLAEQLQKYYAPAAVTSLGWINCDRFYDNPQQVEMQFDLPITLNNTRIEYFVIFKKFNGLIKGRVVNDGQTAIAIPSLPLNEEVTLVAFTKSKGVIYQAKTDFRIQRKAAMPLEFRQVSMGEMNKMFGRNMKI